MFWTQIAIVAAAGALGAVLAQMGIAIYNDGLRALAAEAKSGRLPGLQLRSAAFKLSFAMLAAFAIPVSFVSGLLLVHALWLGTDLIGVWLFASTNSTPASGWKFYRKTALALAAGAIYGGGLVLCLKGIGHLSGLLPLPLNVGLSGLAQPVVFSFAAFPAIAIAYQHGIRAGGLAFGFILLVRFLTGWLGATQPDTWALAVGMLIVFLTALREQTSPIASPAPIFSEHASLLRRRLPIVAVLGALYGLAAQQLTLVEGPQALLALAGSRAFPIGVVIAIGIARALAFTPIKTMSVLASGVFVTDGLGLSWAVGLSAPNTWMAAMLGGLVMCLELLALGRLSQLLQHFPGLAKAAGHMRTAMTRLLEAALLVGGMLATENLAPGYGFLGVAGIYLLNEASGTRLQRVAVPPLAVLLIWLSANLAAFIG